ncbi:uncharacterized protein LOC141905457 [Tubulanus polymorphus]|uniref:uncharacterized protein LOC141905457 n=1 Tax=Tubulanus polymorphus TaxID=672921 RepID=UPI003DA3CE3C
MAKLLRKFGGKKAPPAPPKRDYNKRFGVATESFDDGDLIDRELGAVGGLDSPSSPGLPLRRDTGDINCSPPTGASPTDTLSSFQTCLSDTFPRNREKLAAGLAAAAVAKSREFENARKDKYLDDYSEPLDAKSSEFQLNFLSSGDDSYTEPYDAQNTVQQLRKYSLDAEDDDGKLYDDPLDCDLDDVAGFEEFSEYPADERPKEDYEDPWEWSFKNRLVTQIKDMAQSESMHFDQGSEAGAREKESQMELDICKMMDSALNSDSAGRDMSLLNDDDDDDGLNLSAGNYEEPWDLRAKTEELECKFRAAKKRTSATEEQIQVQDDVGGLVGEIFGQLDGDSFMLKDTAVEAEKEKPKGGESRIKRAVREANKDAAGQQSAGGPRFLRQEDFLPKGKTEEKRYQEEPVAVDVKEPKERTPRDKPPIKPTKDKDGKKRPQPKPRRKGKDEVAQDRVRHAGKHEQNEGKQVKHAETQFDPSVRCKEGHHHKHAKERDECQQQMNERESKSTGNTRVKAKKRDDTLEKKLREKYNLVDGDSSSESYGYGPFNGYRGGIVQNREASRSDSWTFLCFDPETEFKKFKSPENKAGVGSGPPPVPAQPPPSLPPQLPAQPPPSLPPQQATPPSQLRQTAVPPPVPRERTQPSSAPSNIPVDLPPPVPTQPIPAARNIPTDPPPPPPPNSERPSASKPVERPAISSRNAGSDRPPEPPRSNPPKRNQPPKEDYDEPWDKKNVFQQLATSAGGHMSEPPQQPPPPPKPRNVEQSCKSVGERVDPNLPLKKQEWYHGSISRVDAENLLRVHKEGSYLVRNSESSKDDFSLSLKSARGFMHMKIVCREGSYILGQFSQPYKSIPEMIHHYSIHKLPIKGAEHMSLLHPVMHEML